MLGKASYVLEACGGTAILNPENPTLPTLRGCGYSSKDAVCLVCDAFDISCIPVVQNCLIGFLLTLSYFMVGFC